ncbi:DUF934 domain-containing protein [Cupriavidus basilensis]
MPHNLKLLTQDEHAVTEDTLVLANDADLDQVDLAALARVARIDLNFPKFTDGRAFSQALLLRRRFSYRGEIRATGEVLVDQLVQMRRCGFTAAVLRADQSAAVGQRQLERFAAFYQGDVDRPEPLRSPD